MVKIVDTNNNSKFEEQVNELMKQGYRLSSSHCSYVGEVGNSVYDCNCLMAILVKEDSEKDSEKDCKYLQRDPRCNNVLSSVFDCDHVSCQTDCNVYVEKEI